MPKMPTFMRNVQTKLINYLWHVDELIDYHKKTIGLLQTLKFAIIFDSAKKSMPKETKMITWDHQKFIKFKRVYNKALEEGKTKEEIIKFEGDDYVIGYAKYLIEYLESKFKN